MKPTTVRSTPGFSPSALTMIWSSPGATKPVQEATTRWVIRSRSASMSRSASAFSASCGAQASNLRIRSPVEGKAPSA